MLQKVLCVDDDAVTLMLLQFMLERTSFCKEIVTAADGLKASEFLQANGVGSADLLFLDLNMPVRNGWFLLDEIEKQETGAQEKPKVIVLSSSINPADEARAVEYEFVIGFLCKPLTMEKIEVLKENPFLRHRFV